MMPALAAAPPRNLWTDRPGGPAGAESAQSSVCTETPT